MATTDQTLAPQVQQQTPVQSQTAPDPAHEILSPLSIDDSLKADAWEIYHNSEGKEFEDKLGATSLPQETKAALWEAKNKPAKEAAQAVEAKNQKNYGEQITHPERQQLPAGAQMPSTPPALVPEKSQQGPSFLTPEKAPQEPQGSFLTKAMTPVGMHGPGTMPAPEESAKNVNKTYGAIGEAGGEFGKKAAEFATTHAPAPQARVLAPQTPAPPPPITQEQLNVQSPGMAGTIRAVGGFAGGFADPRMWPLFFIGGETMGPILQKVVSGAFAAQMTAGALQQAQYLAEHWDELKPEQRSEMIANAGLTSLFATMSGLHFIHGIPDAISDYTSQEGKNVRALRDKRIEADKKLEEIEEKYKSYQGSTKKGYTAPEDLEKARNEAQVAAAEARFHEQNAVDAYKERQTKREAARTAKNQPTAENIEVMKQPGEKPGLTPVVPPKEFEVKRPPVGMPPAGTEQPLPPMAPGYGKIPLERVGEQPKPELKEMPVVPPQGEPEAKPVVAPEAKAPTAPVPAAPKPVEPVWSTDVEKNAAEQQRKAMAEKPVVRRQPLGAYGEVQPGLPQIQPPERGEFPVVPERPRTVAEATAPKVEAPVVKEPTLEEKGAAAAAEHPQQGRVNQVVFELGNDDLRNMATNLGIDPNDPKYKFGAGVERTKPNEAGKGGRMQPGRKALAEAVANKLSDEQKTTVANGLDQIEKTGLWNDQDISGSGKAGRSRALLGDFLKDKGEEGGQVAAPGEAPKPTLPGIKQEFTKGAPLDEFGNAKVAGGAPEGEPAKPEEKNQVDAHNENGGSTFHPTKGNLLGKQAFAVGGEPEFKNPDLKMVIDGKTLTQAQLDEFNNRPAVKEALAKHKDASVGTWYDKDIDKTITELVKTPTNREEAIAMGQKNGEKAIYDLGEGKEIKVERRAQERPAGMTVEQEAEAMKNRKAPQGAAEAEALPLGQTPNVIAQTEGAKETINRATNQAIPRPGEEAKTAEEIRARGMGISNAPDLRTPETPAETKVEGKEKAEVAPVTPEEKPEETEQRNKEFLQGLKRISEGDQPFIDRIDHILDKYYPEGTNTVKDLSPEDFKKIETEASEADKHELKAMGILWDEGEEKPETKEEPTPEFSKEDQLRLQGMGVRETPKAPKGAPRDEFGNPLVGGGAPTLTNLGEKPGLAKIRPVEERFGQRNPIAEPTRPGMPEKVKLTKAQAAPPEGTSTDTADAWKEEYRKAMAKVNQGKAAEKAEAVAKPAGESPEVKAAKKTLFDAQVKLANAKGADKVAAQGAVDNAQAELDKVREGIGQGRTVAGGQTKMDAGKLDLSGHEARVNAAKADGTLKDENFFPYSMGNDKASLAEQERLYKEVADKYGTDTANRLQDSVIDRTLGRRVAPIDILDKLGKEKGQEKLNSFGAQYAKEMKDFLASDGKVNIPVPAPITYYHGTAESRLDSILKNGVKAEYTGKSQGEVSKRPYDFERTDRKEKYPGTVFVTPDIDTAGRYGFNAEPGEGGKYGDPGVVVEMSVPYDLYRHFQSDSVGDDMHHGDIPSEHITAYHVHNKDGSWTRYPVEDGKVSAKGEEPRSLGAAARGGAAKARKPALPTDKQLLDKYGKAAGPGDTAFITADGTPIHNAGFEHEHALNGGPGDNQRERFINEQNGIRMRTSGVYGDRQFAFTMPENITRSQLSQLHEWLPQLKTGRIYIERPEAGSGYGIVGHGEASEESLGQALKNAGIGIKEVGPQSVGAAKGAAAPAREGWKGPLSRALTWDRLPDIAKKNLTQEEWEGLKTPEKVAKFVSVLTNLPDVQEYKDIALAGEGARHWYQRSAKAFDAMFEEAPEYFKEPGDKDKFINLLASSSPRQSVANNLRETLKAWMAYVDADRPTGEPLENLLTESLTPAVSKVPNAFKALSDKELWPDLSKNNAFKVPSFARNLRGWLGSVTNDGWMSLFAGIDPNKISGPESYHPLAVVTRAAAKELGWEPAEAQAAIWSFTQALTERGEELPEEVRKYSEDFVDLLAHDPQVRNLLADLGVSHDNLDTKLKAIGEKPEVSGRTTGSTSRSIGKLKERIEEARGKGTIPPPKSSQGQLFREGPYRDEAVGFNPAKFQTQTSGELESYGKAKKKNPLGKIGQ